MTRREVSTRLPRTQAVADALAKWIEIGSKKPKRTYGRKWCETPRPKSKEIKP